MITETDVRYTLSLLQQAGKTLPLGIMRNNKDQYQSLVNLWLQTFREESIVIWQRATRIAVTLSRIRGSLNVNTITPALMQEAVYRAVEEMRSQDSLKPAENNVPERKPLTERERYRNLKCLQWFSKRWKARLYDITFKPSDEEALAFGRDLGLTDEEAAENRQLLTIYLWDRNLFGFLKRPMPYEIYINSDRLVAFTRGGVPSENGSPAAAASEAVRAVSQQVSQ